MNDKLPKEKVCTECGTEHPRTLEFFSKYSGRSVDGLRPVCRSCEREYNREYKRRRREEAKA